MSMTTSLSEDSFKEEIQRQGAVLLLKFIHGDSSSMTPTSAILSSSSCASSSSPSMPSIFCFKPLLSDFYRIYAKPLPSDPHPLPPCFLSQPRRLQSPAAPHLPGQFHVRWSPCIFAVGAHAPRTAAIIRPAAITINFFIMYLLVFSSQQLLHGFRNRFCLSHLFPSSVDYIHSFYRCPSLTLNH